MRIRRLTGVDQSYKQVDGIQQQIESTRPPRHFARATQVHYDHWEQGDVAPRYRASEIIDLELESTLCDEARLDRPRNCKSQEHILHIRTQGICHCHGGLSLPCHNHPRDDVWKRSARSSNCEAEGL